MHSLDGQHQDVDRTSRGRVSQNDRGQRYINGESISMVWPTLGSRMAKEQNIWRHQQLFFRFFFGFCTVCLEQILALLG